MTGPTIVAAPLVSMPLVSSIKGCIPIKDPMAKHLTVYDVPFDKIIPTAGLKGKGHRSCLCMLFLKGRCGQGKKCKSFHVDRVFVEKMRLEHGVEIEENFITEVVVFNSNNLVFAVRFPAVTKTRGLDEYRRAFSNGTHVPMKLCDSSTCADGESCKHIHIKEAELQSLNTRRLRTPCCGQHGDRHDIKDCAVYRLPGSNTISIPSNMLAWNEASKRIARGHIFSAREICKPHITGRCKYGKSCGHLHVCRIWWKQCGDQSANQTNVTSASVTPNSTQSLTPPRSPRIQQRGGIYYPPSMRMMSGITPTSTPSITPSVTPPPSPRVEKRRVVISDQRLAPAYRFINDDNELSDLINEESFTLPVWNEKSPPMLGKMCSAEFCRLDPLPLHLQVQQ